MATDDTYTKREGHTHRLGPVAVWTLVYRNDNKPDVHAAAAQEREQRAGADYLVAFREKITTVRRLLPGSREQGVGTEKLFGMAREGAARARASSLGHGNRRTSESRERTKAS